MGVGVLGGVFGCRGPSVGTAVDPMMFGYWLMTDMRNSGRQKRREIFCLDIRDNMRLIFFNVHNFICFNIFCV